MLGARPFALAEDPLLRSATDRIAAQLHVAPPKLCLIDDGFPRAFVVGRGPGGSTLAVSTGLLRVARREELEAVIAHELAHVRSLDVLTQTFAVLLATTLVEASRLGGFLSRALLFVLGADRRGVHPCAAVAPARVRGRPRRRERLRARTTSRTRSCASTGRPSSSTFAASPATEPLYLDRPVRARPALPDVPHASAARERVRRLRALGGAPGGRPADAELPPAPDQEARPARNEQGHTVAPETQKGHTRVWPFSESNSAASYSPRGSRPKYHRRRRA